MLLLFQMPYTDATDTTHDASVWIPSSITIDPINLQAHIIWNGYATDQARQAAAQPVGQHETAITGAQFLAGMQQAAPSGSFGAVFAQAAIGFGQSVADTPNGQTNADGTNMVVPFFAGATVITDAS